MEIGAPFPTFCGGGGGVKKNFNFFFSFSRNPIIHIVCIYQCFFPDGMYSVLTILCNYLQMINQITLFKKIYFLNINVKIALKILIKINFKTTLQMNLKKLYERKDNIARSTLSNFYVTNYKSLR